MLNFLNSQHSFESLKSYPKMRVWEHCRKYCFERSHFPLSPPVSGFSQIRCVPWKKISHLSPLMMLQFTLCRGLWVLSDEFWMGREVPQYNTLQTLSGVQSVGSYESKCEKNLIRIIIIILNPWTFILEEDSIFNSTNDPKA